MVLCGFISLWLTLKFLFLNYSYFCTFFSLFFCLLFFYAEICKLKWHLQYIFMVLYLLKLVMLVLKRAILYLQYAHICHLF